MEFLHPADVRTPAPSSARPGGRNPAFSPWRPGLPLRQTEPTSGSPGPRGRGGAPASSPLLGREMTEQKYLEESLEQAQARMRTMQDIAESSIHPLQPRATGTAASRAGQQGPAGPARAHPGRAGKPHLEGPHAPSATTGPDSRRHEAARRTGKVQKGYEKELIRKDGSLVPASIFVHAVAGDADGTPIHFAFVKDISDRKQAEERLRAEEGLLGTPLPERPGRHRHRALRRPEDRQRQRPLLRVLRLRPGGDRRPEAERPGRPGKPANRGGHPRPASSRRGMEAAPRRNRAGAARTAPSLDVAIQSALIMDGENSLGYYTLYRDTRQVKIAEANVREKPRAA
ncbi:MAG: PAS domain S-box protein [Candidatus Moduliflexus flocculans]|nr:PAS domain S-box protein [Candidatus Moduliflexus flocculans]